MKKLFLMASLMMLSLGTFAQRAPGTFSYMPKFGLNIATLTDFDDADPRLGLVAGAEMEYQATDMVSFTLGALYSQQGCKQKAGGNILGIDMNTKTTIKTDYLNIPIMANVYITKGLAVKLGLQPGFNLAGKYKYSGSVAGFEGNGEGDIDDIKTFDLALPIGISYEFDKFVIDGRYNFGLTKVFDSAENKHSVFQITLGYKIDM
ncbi:MAG: PorT family protein [Prevotella sp.]|nr:PorT family protein [Prevotella sp.]